MKIGILFPLSKEYPGIGMDFMDGFNSFLKFKAQISEVTILKESISFGGEEKDVYQKAEKLLISDDVDILVAYIDEKVVSMLYPLVQATGKLLLLVNPGANYPLNWISQPTVIRLNLQHAFLCYLTGKPAASNGNGKAALATTYYDCGYLHSAAMVNNFLSEGGELMYNYVNNQAYNDSFDINNLTDFLSANPDCKNLLCVFDQRPAALFSKLLEQYENKNHLHLFASPMMMQQVIENNKEGFSYAVEGYLSWINDPANEANQQFQKLCARPVSIFSLLGWEIAIVLSEIFESCKDNFTNGEFIVAHLKNNPLNGIRGKLVLDDETQFYLAPVIKCRLDAGESNPVIDIVHDIGNDWKNFTAKPTEGAVTGWTNTYLCY